MKALQVIGPGVTEYVDVPIPVPDDDQVLMKIIRNGVCGTDLELVDGSSFFIQNGSTHYPIRIGHEYSAIIVDKGKDVKGWNIGDQVVADGSIYCGTCPECLSGNRDSCHNLRAVGTLRAWPGSYAEYMTLPAENLFLVPPGISHDNAALMEPAAIGMAGLDKLNIVPGKSIVLVTGVGAIGLSCVALSKWLGAKQVIVSGRTPYKLDIAKKLGADVIINPREQDFVKTVKDITNGHGADCIIECSGSVDALDDNFKVLTPRGVMTIIAFFGRNYEHFDLDTFVLSDADIRASCLHDFLNVIKAMQEGVDLSPLITRHITFDEAKDFLEQQVKVKSNDIKVMVDVAEP